ncbi:hypothetical protein EVAR_101931_1 [Eumeta japonica]|uniref:Uncharacterized protein n=1 Tax=Eumeta variegata TaxID=151549 RepID=A0A4C1TSC9_EUMVA|nr:hypothetical protein EVAR_101931_1 [Eumeta japonica]
MPRSISWDLKSPVLARCGSGADNDRRRRRDDGAPSGWLGVLSEARTVWWNLTLVKSSPHKLDFASQSDDGLAVQRYRVRVFRRRIVEALDARVGGRVKPSVPVASPTRARPEWTA